MPRKLKTPTAGAAANQEIPGAGGTGTGSAPPSSAHAAHRTKPKMTRKTPRASAGVPTMGQGSMSVSDAAQLTKLILGNLVAGHSKAQNQERMLAHVRSIFASI